MLLRAFASGAVALTGTEAIATGVPAFKPPEAKNAATTLLVMAGPPDHPLRRDHLPRDQLRDLPDDDRQQDGHRPGRQHRVRGRLAASTCSRRSRRSSSSSPRTRASPPSRVWPRSLPTTASCPRQFAFAATASRSRRASSLLGRSRRRWSSSLRRPIPTLSSRSTRWACSSTSRSARRAWSGTGCATRDQGWRYRIVINAVRRCVATAIVAVVVTAREVPRRRVVRGRPDPDPRGHDAVHPPRVRHPGARAACPR